MQDMQPQEPEFNPEAGMGMPAGAELPNGETDHEGAMAKADLFKLANYSKKLFERISDDEQLEAWVQAKITKAADYVASVYHYLEYEMEFSEYGKKIEDSEMYTESQKHILKTRLMEAKSKVKELKKAQADKIKETQSPKKVAEGVLSGGERPCSECGGSGMVYEEPKAVPGHVKAKVEKYNRQAKAMHAASKRIDKNKNGIPDDEELGEETSSTGGEITRGKGFTRHAHNPKRFSDEPHTEPASKAKSKSAAEKSGDKAADKAEEKEGKAWEKAHGKGSVTRVKDGKKVDEMFGQGVYEGKTEVQYDKDGKRTGVKHTSTHKYSDEPHTEPKSQAKSRSAAEKAGDKAADKAQEKDYKAAKKANPTGVRRYSLGKQVDEAAKPDFLDMDKDGNKKEPMKKAVSDKKKNPFAKKSVKEAKKAKPDYLDADKDGDEKEPMKKAFKDKAKANIKEAIANAKKQLEGSIQNGVWVAQPDKGVPAPSGDPEGVPAKKAAADKKAADAKKAVVVKESADLDRMKQFLTRLNG